MRVGRYIDVNWLRKHKHDSAWKVDFPADFPGNTFPPYLAGFTRVLSASFESRPYDHKALRSAFFLVNRGRDGVGDFTMPVYFQRPENALKRANGKK